MRMRPWGIRLPDRVFTTRSYGYNSRIGPSGPFVEGKGALMSSDNEEKAGAGGISSPEQLNDYLKVTNPKIWVLLTAVVLLVGGLLLWCGFTTVESYATGTARAVGGDLYVSFDDQAKAGKVSPGMEMEVGDVKTEILTVGKGDDGEIMAFAHANIPDGSYAVRVGYKTTQVLSMLLN